MRNWFLFKIWKIWQLGKNIDSFKYLIWSTWKSLILSAQQVKDWTKLNALYQREQGTFTRMRFVFIPYICTVAKCEAWSKRCFSTIRNDHSNHRWHPVMKVLTALMFDGDCTLVSKDTSQTLILSALVWAAVSHAEVPLWWSHESQRKCRL